MSLEGCRHCFGEDAHAVWNHSRALESLAAIVEESHFSVRILACPDCAQRFASVFCERIDWAGGNDPQDWLLVPLTVEEADAAVSAGENGVEGVLRKLGNRRYLLRFFPSSADEPELRWRDGLVIVPPHD